jgi:hypothetical protein
MMVSASLLVWRSSSTWVVCSTSQVIGGVSYPSDSKPLEPNNTLYNAQNNNVLPGWLEIIMYQSLSGDVFMLSRITPIT